MMAENPPLDRDHAAFRLSRLAGAVLLLAMAAAPLPAQGGRRGFIGLDIGPSQPFGAFQERAGREGAGNARAGYTSTLVNVGWRRGAHWGIAGSLSYSEFLMRATDGPGDDWWQVAFLTVGPMYTIPLGAKTAVDLKGTLGLAALTPVIDSYVSDSDTGSGLAIDLRATMRYDVSSRWAVFAETGVQSAAVTFFGGGSQQYRAAISGFGLAYRPRWARSLRE